MRRSHVVNGSFASNELGWELPVLPRTRKSKRPNPFRPVDEASAAGDEPYRLIGIRCASRVYPPLAVPFNEEARDRSRFQGV